MSTLFGSNPTFNSFHFSGVNAWNQESTNSSFSITAPGRVIDIGAYFAGDGETTNAQIGMWKASDNSLELSSSSFTAPSGSESTNGQTFNSRSVDYFFNSTHSVEVGFWRDKAKSSVVSVATSGTDGQTKNNVTSITSMSSASSFNTVYGSLGKGLMKGQGHYIASTIYVRRAGAWVPVPVYVRRSGAWTQVKVYVRRTGAWTLLNMVPSDKWGDEVEKAAMIVYPNGDWERAVIREEGKVRFGNVVDPLHNWEDPDGEVHTKIERVEPILVPA